MFVLMIVVFVLGYTAIALEHPLKVNKTASALLLGVVLWTLLIFGGQSILVDASGFKAYLEHVAGGTFTDWISHHTLLHHLGEISEIIFFLLGAMTIVELIDSHEGFKIITERIKSTKKVKLLWVLSFITFFMSAVLDNLTTSIVMVALLRKLVADKADKWFFAGMIIVAANAGGAWSPIGDVTTIMLWIAGHVTTGNIILKTFFPSLVSMVIPLIILTFTLKGNVNRPEKVSNGEDENGFDPTTPFERYLIFFLGVGSLLFVPVFKTFTHLPPYLGMLWGLGLLWVVTEIIHKSKNEEHRTSLSVVGVLQRVDVPSVLFFLGILIAVASLQTAGHLALLADYLRENVGNIYTINVIIGMLSSVVDNVPLVAAAMGMYSYPPDHYFWEFLAYCAGTGGSLLIIGSAAGVAVMGMEKIDFIWYFKKISLLALTGYLAGAGAFILQEESGILSFHKSETHFKLNLNDSQEVLQYLTNYEFLATSVDSLSEIHDGNGEFLHFIKVIENGDNYLGYSKKTINDEDKSWSGTIRKSKCQIEKHSAEMIKIMLLDVTYYLNQEGILFESRNSDSGNYKVVWKRSQQKSEE